jgi:queuine/archaeosine tRNA-ribosyltransferase
MAKKKEEVIETPVVIPVAIKPIEKTEKELLVECYEFMKSRGINSISDIENKIARL